MLVAAIPARGSPRPAEETRTGSACFLCGLGFFVVGLCRLAGRDFCPFAFRLRPLAWFFVLVRLILLDLVGQRVDQDRNAEVDAALLLAQRAYWIYLACATGRYETREQRSGQKDRNHDRKSR